MTSEIHSEIYWPLDKSKIEISKKQALQYEMQSWGKKQEIANKNKIKKRGYETHKVNVA